jgi:hypothetical protein
LGRKFAPQAGNGGVMKFYRDIFLISLTLNLSLKSYPLPRSKSNPKPKSNPNPNPNPAVLVLEDIVVFLIKRMEEEVFLKIYNGKIMS